MTKKEDLKKCLKCKLKKHCIKNNSYIRALFKEYLKEKLKNDNKK